MKIINDLNQCTGCCACALACTKGAIKMLPNTHGFLEPVLDELVCIGCKKCVNACHINKPPKKLPYSESIIAVNKNDTIRNDSTSGGVFYEIAKAILSKNGIVIGAAWNKEFGVEHVAIDKLTDLYKLQNAKYLQSNLYTIYKTVQEALAKDRYVVFSGTPCQISGLKSFLGKDSPKLTTVELICHGVPSPAVWSKYLSYRKELDNTNGQICQINMRSKTTGWTSYSVDIEYTDGTKYCRKWIDDPYMISFVNNMTLRSSCLDCQFKGTDRIGDITLGDCWGIWNFAPEMNDNKGASMVLLNSPKGKEVWNQISESFNTKNINLHEIVGDNLSLLKSSIPHPKRKEILDSLNGNGFTLLLQEVDKIIDERMKAHQENNKFFSRVNMSVRKLIHSILGG